MNDFLTLDPLLRKAAELAATKERRSLTSFIETVLADYLRRTGYLPRTLRPDEGLRPHELTSENDG
jgi:hypothetical protein